METSTSRESWEHEIAGVGGPIGSLYPQGTENPWIGLMTEFSWYSQCSWISAPEGEQLFKFDATLGTSRGPNAKRVMGTDQCLFFTYIKFS